MYVCALVFVCVLCVFMHVCTSMYICKLYMYILYAVNTDYHFHCILYAPQVCSPAGITGNMSGVANPLIQLFQRLYGTRAVPNIIKYNNFTDVGAYYLLKVKSSSLTLPLQLMTYFL